MPRARSLLPTRASAITAAINDIGERGATLALNAWCRSAGVDAVRADLLLQLHAAFAARDVALADADAGQNAVSSHRRRAECMRRMTVQRRSDGSAPWHGIWCLLGGALLNEVTDENRQCNPE